SPSPIDYPLTSAAIPPTINLNEIARYYDGKLLLREEIHLSNETFQYLNQHRYFTPSPSFSKTPLFHRCERCYFKQTPPFSTIPCMRCQREHIYCRHCIEMGRVLGCEPLYAWTGNSYQ